jgi:hypothetical protein
MKSAFLANFIKLLFNISQVCLMAAEAERLFPTGNEPHRNLIIREGPPRPFGLEEIEKAGRRLKSGKAPGPDGIPSEVIKDMLNIRTSLRK